MTSGRKEGGGVTTLHYTGFGFGFGFRVKVGFGILSRPTCCELVLLIRVTVGAVFRGNRG